jgi:hypothetical protein
MNMVATDDDDDDDDDEDHDEAQTSNGLEAARVQINADRFPQKGLWWKSK